MELIEPTLINISVKNCQSIVHINQSLNKVVLPEIRNVKGYLNFDMIGCNNNEKAYSYGLSLHESVPCFR